MKSFIEAETEVDRAARTARTSRILGWYARGFGGPTGVLATIAVALDLPETKLSGMRLSGMRLLYRPYDWSLDDGG